MRVTGGSARGVVLRAPAGGAVRPATDRLRGSIFSRLGETVRGARFLDCFAGSGAYGLEALSRGAAGGIFVERDRAALGFLRQNLAAVGKSAGIAPDALAASVRVIGADCLRWRPGGGETFDLIIADPPYKAAGDAATAVFDLAQQHLAPNGNLAFELPGEFDPDRSGWEVVRRFGKPGARGAPMVVLYARAQNVG